MVGEGAPATKNCAGKRVIANPDPVLRTFLCLARCEADAWVSLHSLQLHKFGDPV